MKTKSLAILMLVVLFPSFSSAALSDAQALAKAKTIWGTKAMIGKVRGPLDTYWTMIVGFKDTTDKFQTVGIGKNTYDDAFKNLPETTSIKLTWPTVPRPTNDPTILVVGYNLYKSRVEGTFTDPPINGAVLISTPEYHTMIDFNTWYFILRSVDQNGIESPDSAVLTVLPGAKSVF